MHRRNFLQLVAAAAPALAGPRPPRPIVRSTHLYREPEREALSEVHWLPRILPLEKTIVTLRYNVQDRSGTVSAAVPEGDQLWEHQLPHDWYDGLGASGKTILITTMSSKILGLDTQSGDLTIYGKADKTGIQGGLVCGGDGTLIRLAPSQIEIWTVEPNVALGHHISAQLAKESQVDVLAPGTAVIAGGDGKSAWIIDTATGKSREYEIDRDAILEGSLFRIATGNDRQRKLALLLFIPDDTNQPMPCVTLDSEGNVRRYGSFERHARAIPIRVMKYGSELGIAHGDGSVAWYTE